MTDRSEPSRRDFIAMSTLGLLGATGLARGDVPVSDSQLLYVGTYTDDKRTDGIYLVRMNVTTGALHLETAVNAGPNPSFIAIHPNGRTLYAVNEVEKRGEKASGGVSAFSIASDTAALTRISDQASEGGAPCYASVDRRGRALLVANYSGGNVALLPIQPGGALSPAANVAQHRGNGPNAERQEAAHAHCIVSDPSNRYVLAADLGIDKVVVYRLDAERALEHVETGDAQLEPGSGPRHIAFHPTLPLVYVATELNSAVTRLRFDGEHGVLMPIDARTTLPSGWKGTSYAADIHVAPSGRTLYVSNRGHNSVAVFSIDTAGALTLEQTMPTGGDWPRNFSIDPTGRWLLVANQRSSDIVVFARDRDSGRLTATRQRIAIPSPACVRFRAHVGVTT
jgi:6-phosphogluconolactonase